MNEANATNCLQKKKKKKRMVGISLLTKGAVNGESTCRPVLRGWSLPRSKGSDGLSGLDMDPSVSQLLSDFGPVCGPNRAVAQEAVNLGISNSNFILEALQAFL